MKINLLKIQKKCIFGKIDCMKWLFLFALLSISNTAIKAQIEYGKITGKVVDKNDNVPIPFVFISVQGKGNQKTTATTDFYGNYEIDSLPSGIYTLHYSVLSFNEKQIENIVVQAPQTTNLPTVVMLSKKTSRIIDCFPPMISLYENPSETVITRNEIEHMPLRK
jgi:hypothetical protein